jgi:hypothetical protein
VLHFDNQSVFKERIFRDKGDAKILHDEVTVIDHALTRPWTVDKKYAHSLNPRPRWTESSCIETNSMVALLYGGPSSSGAVARTVPFS